MRLLLCITLILELLSCKTSIKESPSESLAPEPQTSEIICRAKGPDQRFLQLNATLTTVEGVMTPTALHGEWRVVTSAGAVFQTGVLQANTSELTQKTTLINIKDISATFLFGETPSLALGTKSSPCMVLQSQSSNSAKSSASCNAIGTPSQGWYANGKLLKHSHSCNTEVLACGSAENKEGWFVQKKMGRVRVAEERCAWRREKPVCKKNMDGTSGWFLSDRLVARDDECSKKSIECTPSTKNEGWFTFRKSDPQLLMASGCNSLPSHQKTAKNLIP